MDRMMKLIMVAGALLVIFGIVGFAVPVFTTEETRDVVKIGELKVQTQENTPHGIPPLVSAGAVILGIILIGSGRFGRR